jgi:hypothetical protein
MKCPTEFGETKYRTIGETRIIDLLLLHGWAFEVRSGGRSRAEQEARAAVDRFVALGLPYRESQTGERLFDPVEAVNFVRWACFQYDDRTLTDRCLPTARGLVYEAHPRGPGLNLLPKPGALVPQQYEVRITRTFNLESRLPGERLRLRLPLAIEGPALHNIQTTFLPPEGLELNTVSVSAPARLDALITGHAGTEISIGIRMKFTARSFAPAGSGAILDSSEAELYTRRSEGLIRVSERIEGLAADLARGQNNRWSLLAEFWNFMLDNLRGSAL